MIDRTVFAQRQDKVFAQLPENSIAIVLGAKEQTRNRDVHYPFRQHSDLLYLLGFSEPDAALVFIKNTTGSVLWFFCREKDPLKEQWDGRRLGPEAAVDALGVDEAFSFNLFSEKVEALSASADQVFLTDDLHEPLLADCEDKIKPLGALVHALRQIKDEGELALMQGVAELSVNAHRAAMQACKVGLHEYSLEAALEHSVRWQGAQAMAYPSIVASGDNATILHYVENDQSLEDGDLVLIDAGGELNGYAADITRTFPVNGKFSQPQKEIYELVLKAQLAGIEEAKPGSSMVVIQEVINKVLVEGLVELKILTGDVEQLLSEKAQVPYTVHGCGHWLGLDVHDVGAYFLDEKKSNPIPFQHGMVITVEPGLYFKPDDTTVPEQYRGIGIRIEDDVYITESGHHVLTEGLEKTVDAIEQLMQRI
ncbi:MAG: Xaa-Pro aminopeptidase [Legionellales bacterium]|nr:Xaa-Pro aminopeptidase [Legionellales bacterium]|tara:strand:- start:653 stop:1924 length:1272 start_codon:yes stop_codon:yes gene_type:complete